MPDTDVGARLSRYRLIDAAARLAGVHPSKMGFHTWTFEGAGKVSEMATYLRQSIEDGKLPATDATGTAIYSRTNPPGLYDAYLERSDLCLLMRELGITSDLMVCDDGVCDDSNRNNPTPPELPKFLQFSPHFISQKLAIALEAGYDVWRDARYAKDAPSANRAQKTAKQAIIARMQILANERGLSISDDEAGRLASLVNTDGAGGRPKDTPH